MRYWWPFIISGVLAIAIMGYLSWSLAAGPQYGDIRPGCTPDGVCTTWNGATSWQVASTALHRTLSTPTPVAP